MGVRTAVVGASGYAGGELLRLLDAHPTLEIATVVAGTNAGRPLGELHPHLVTLADRIAARHLDARAGGCRGGLPRASARRVGRGLDSLAADAIVVDLGADFRLTDAAAWQRWYSGEHAGHLAVRRCPSSRVCAPRLPAPQRVANPGCYATAVALGLAPLLAAGLVEPDDIVVVAASGTTGAGRTPTVNLLASEVMGDVTAYKVAGAHQHLGEMRQALSAVAGTAVSMSFTPMLVPMPRGILATCTATVRAGVGAAELRAGVRRLRRRAVRDPAAGRPAAAHGRDDSAPTAPTCRSALDADAGRAVVVVAIDNLGKGAAGQAVQNANLLLGLPETTGLTVNGVGQ